MDTLIVIIMLVLFVFLMIFIFSTALLTPMIGKKNLLFVLSLGFVVGLVGGTFFISPLYDDIPDMARYVYTFSTGTPEVIHVNMSTDNDVNGFIDSTKKLNGVKDVQCNKLTMRITPFDTGEWAGTFEDRIPILDSNINSVQVVSNDTLVLNLNNTTNPTTVVKTVGDWLGLIGGMEVYTNTAEIAITVDPSQVDSVSSKLPEDEVVITGTTGPVEDQINNFKKNLPDKTTIVLLCGILGVIVGAIGIFIDSIAQLFDRLRLWLKLRRK